MGTIEPTVDLERHASEIGKAIRNAAEATIPARRTSKKHWISEKTMKLVGGKRKLRLVKHVSPRQAELPKDMCWKVWASRVNVVCFFHLRGVRRRKDNKKGAERDPASAQARDGSTEKGLPYPEPRKIRIDLRRTDMFILRWKRSERHPCPT